MLHYFLKSILFYSSINNVQKQYNVYISTKLTHLSLMVHFM